MHLRFLDDPPPPPQEWLVHGLFPKGCVTVVAGAAGCGKTALVTNLVVAGCTGGSWLDIPVNGGPTLWLAAEAAASTERRLRALADTGSRTLPISIASPVPNLLDEDAFEAISTAIDAVSKRLGVPIEIVVLDALASSMRGADENAARDMTRVMGVLLDLVEKKNVTVIVLAHTGKSGDANVRGHSSVIADATAAFAITEKSGCKRLICLKQRDHEMSKPIPLHIVADCSALRVERVADERGEPAEREGGVTSAESVSPAPPLGGALTH
ncbi:AAA domain-containing protein [Filomicrobium insigne]|uniref:AAA domain-containing protein n=1 Tax=Filomicrobium insigne TaxID=418854 RepID=A0A1H0HNQ5_9HYPH|nr:AAA family ATPase [Filomicrobium insigne]SDO20471.1 AAA domain-containing protein [Filomicrobium insigne]